MMRNALIADIVAANPSVDLICTCDPRLPAPLTGEVVWITSDIEIWDIWRSIIADADAVWLIAPETGGTLARLAEEVVAQGKQLLGPTPEAIRLASSKYATYCLLHDAGVQMVPTCRAGTWAEFSSSYPEETLWVIKPDDGVSCEGVTIFSQTSAVQPDLLNVASHDLIVQPYRSGVAASISMLCRDGEAWLLSCNQQLVVRENAHFIYRGSTVNGMANAWTAFESLAKQVARAMSGLSGYVGIDVIVRDDSFECIEVLEVNPRLTTSYVGLHASIGCNPAAMVLDLLSSSQMHPLAFAVPPLRKDIVEVTL